MQDYTYVLRYVTACAVILLHVLLLYYVCFDIFLPVQFDYTKCAMLLYCMCFIILHVLW